MVEIHAHIVSEDCIKLTANRSRCERPCHAPPVHSQLGSWGALSGPTARTVLSRVNCCQVVLSISHAGTYINTWGGLLKIGTATRLFCVFNVFNEYRLQCEGVDSPPCTYCIRYQKHGCCEDEVACRLRNEENHDALYIAPVQTHPPSLVVQRTTSLVVPSPPRCRPSCGGQVIELGHLIFRQCLRGVLVEVPSDGTTLQQEPSRQQGHDTARERERTATALKRP